jgi:hypothetical protein
MQDMKPTILRAAALMKMQSSVDGKASREEALDILDLAETFKPSKQGTFEFKGVDPSTLSSHVYEGP